MLRPSLSLVVLALAYPLPVHGRQTPAPNPDRDAQSKYPPPSTLSVTRDLEYARYADRRLLLDLYKPPGTTTTPLPIIAVVRGGGWLRGDKDGFAFIAGYIANAGFATACIEYRPSTEAQFPAAIHDVKAAVRWLRANATRLGVDGSRIGAIGGSAGGHLVALLGTSAGEPTLEGSGGNAGVSSDVAAVVAMAPPTDLGAEWSEGKGRESMSSFLGPGLSADDQRLARASPARYVTGTSAPLLLIHSSADSVVPYTQSLRLKARYDERRRPVELVTLAGAPHDFWNYSRWLPEAMQGAIAFFRRTLR